MHKYRMMALLDLGWNSPYIFQCKSSHRDEQKDLKAAIWVAGKNEGLRWERVVLFCWAHDWEIANFQGLRCVRSLNVTSMSLALTAAPGRGMCSLCNISSWGAARVVDTKKCHPIVR